LIHGHPHSFFTGRWVKWLDSDQWDERRKSVPCAHVPLFLFPSHVDTRNKLREKATEKGGGGGGERGRRRESRYGFLLHFAESISYSTQMTISKGFTRHCGTVLILKRKVLFHFLNECFHPNMQNLQHTTA
jgi:hypothetical protein